MSIPDDVMWIWYRELTEISGNDLDELKKLVEEGKFHPMDAKKLLARVVVAGFNHFDTKSVVSAENAFNQKFGKNKILVPEDIQETDAKAGDKVLDLLTDLTGESKATLKKMATTSESSGIKILEGGEYRGLTIGELSEMKLEAGAKLIIKVGKRRFFKISSK